MHHLPTNDLDAEPDYRRALAIDEQSYGPHHPNVAIRLNNLAAFLYATNRLAEAEPLYRRALAISEQSYGPHHPEVARNLNNLALLFRVTNRIVEAIPLYRRALLIFLKEYGGLNGVQNDLQTIFGNYVRACNLTDLPPEISMQQVAEVFKESGVSDEKIKEIFDVALENL